MKVSGLLFNLSLIYGHLSLQPDFVLALTVATSIFPSSCPVVPCQVLMSITLWSSFVVRSVIFFHEFVQHNQPPGS